MTNLESKKIMNEYSQGMILAVYKEDERPIFVAAVEEAAVGAKVR